MKRCFYLQDPHDWFFPQFTCSPWCLLFISFIQKIWLEGLYSTSPQRCLWNSVISWLTWWNLLRLGDALSWILPAFRLVTLAWGSQPRVCTRLYFAGSRGGRWPRGSLRERRRLCRGGLLTHVERTLPTHSPVSTVPRCLAQETHSLLPTHLSQETKEFNLVREAIDTISSLTYIIFSQVTLKTHIYKTKLESIYLLNLSLVV